ncbi:ABC-2 type transport system permease protein [Natranaerovirga hydrolytica]|uniref:Transport permease protein n=1 Tax=Natranaerovirga hydrolytica TaxID=680378 RepID=A0A4R1MRV4_9FIRM|nr:ABC transporter permease [Natranaerovirga hydrolytica]TCK92643.1 ABC-2 type transport system permease protein [Natranaerovirga hydrolytica]
MYCFYQILKRDFLNLFTHLMWIFFSFFYPLLLVVILGYLMSGSYGDTVTSYDYYGITIIVYSVFNTAMTAANSFMEERIKKGNMRIIYVPIPKMYVYLSKIMASFAFSFLWHLGVMWVLGAMWHVNYGGSAMGYLIIILFVLELFAAILGVLFCCIFKSEHIANQLLSIVITVFAMLGGLFFRIGGLGEVFQKISDLSPLKWVTAYIFQIIYDGNLSYYVAFIFLFVMLSLLGLLLCGKIYKQEDYV